MTLPNIFNRILLRNRRQAASNSFANVDFIKKLSSRYILERLKETNTNIDLALDLGAHTGVLGDMLETKNIAKKVIYSDLSENMVSKIKGSKVVLDEEFLPFRNKSFDLITSCMSMHWVNDLPGCLAQIRQCLKPNARFIASIAGIETLSEFRQCLIEAEIELKDGASPHISPFIDVKTAGDLMTRAGFRDVISDREIVKIAYKDIFALAKELKLMGERSALNQIPGFISRNIVKLAAQKYKENFSNEQGSIIATIEIITITGLAT